MGKSELFSHFADRFEVKRTQAREFFDELTTLAEGTDGSKPRDRLGDQDSGQDRRQGTDRQAVEGLGTPAEVGAVASSAPGVSRSEAARQRPICFVRGRACRRGGQAAKTAGRAARSRL